MLSNLIEPVIYTDGSCHTQYCIGSWVAIIIIDHEKTVLSGMVEKTTHNRMELTAVIKSIEFIASNKQFVQELKIVTDSQYVSGLAAREAKLNERNFITTKGTEIRNADLVHQLLDYCKRFRIDFVKIKAHQKLNEESKFNVEADLLARKIVRHAVNKIL